MFKNNYLTVRVMPAERGLQFHANMYCEIDTDCQICSDGCTNCSGDCTQCSATCHGPDSFGALVIDPGAAVELVLDVDGIRELLKKVEKAQSR